MPDELLWAKNPDTEERIKVTPGEHRSGLVTVDQHMLPRAENLTRFLSHFDDAYNPLSGSLSVVKSWKLQVCKDRAARDVLYALIKKGLLVSDTQRGPVRLGFPIEVVERWFPLLFPSTQ